METNTESSCWDGERLDSPNHQDHVTYPVGGPSSFATTGNCPSTHPIKIPQLMLEVRDIYPLPYYERLGIEKPVRM